MWNELTDEVKTELQAFCREILPELHEDCMEYGEACLTVACNGSGSAWNYQTGDNGFTGGAYGLPHWAVVYPCEETTSEELYSEIIEQLEELMNS